MLLTNQEILDAINDAPIAHGAQSFVIAVGRAIEAKVLEKQAQQNAEGVVGVKASAPNLTAAEAEIARYFPIWQTRDEKGRDCPMVRLVDLVGVVAAVWGDAPGVSRLDQPQQENPK